MSAATTSVSADPAAPASDASGHPERAGQAAAAPPRRRTPTLIAALAAAALVGSGGWYAIH